MDSGKMQSRHGGFSMRIVIVTPLAALALFVLSSCGNKNAGPNPKTPHAVIEMRECSTLTGAITATSPTEITLVADDNTSHTIATNQVRSIDYDEAPAPPAQSSPEHKASAALATTPRARPQS